MVRARIKEKDEINTKDIEAYAANVDGNASRPNAKRDYKGFQTSYNEFEYQLLKELIRLTGKKQTATVRHVILRAAKLENLGDKLISLEEIIENCSVLSDDGERLNPFGRAKHKAFTVRFNKYEYEVLERLIADSSAKDRLHAIRIAIYLISIERGLLVEK